MGERGARSGRAETLGRWRLRNWSCNKWPLATQGAFWLVQSEARPYCSCATRRKALPRHRHAGPAHGFGGAFSLMCGFARADRPHFPVTRRLQENRPETGRNTFLRAKNHRNLVFFDRNINDLGCPVAWNFCGIGKSFAKFGRSAVGEKETLEKNLVPPG